MIHIGDKLGKKYEYFRYYIPFVLKYHIRFTNWRHHMEIIKEPDMYLKEGFIPNENQKIFDVGSQYGDWALMWTKKYKAIVFAFEPIKENIKEMFKDMDKNREYKILTYEGFIGDGKPIYYNQNGNMMVYSESGLFTPTTTLDSIVTQTTIIPDIIKIDVEGFEFQVLKGALGVLDTFKPKIILETHSKELREQCHEMLVNFNYKLSYTGRSFKGKDWMDEITNLFYEVKK